MKAPFLDAMMGTQCSKAMKSADRSMSKLQGLVLDAIGPLTQLLEVVNDDQARVTTDQISEAVETAISLLANASYQISAVRRPKVLEEYNKELLPFAAASERDWASAAPHLFGQNFLKEASEYLQQLQLMRKVKEKPSLGFRQPPCKASRGAGITSHGGSCPMLSPAISPRNPSFQEKGLLQKND